MMYQEELLEHYKYPYNKKKLEGQPSFSTEQYNPSCGDSISMEGVVQNGILTKLCFQGKGCVISQATASMLSEYVKDIVYYPYLAISCSIFLHFLVFVLFSTACSSLLHIVALLGTYVGGTG